MDLIVESHECMAHGMTRLLMERFNSTHEITLVEDNGQRQMDTVPAWFNSLAHLDQLLAVWEWRSGPTPWLVMKAKQPHFFQDSLVSSSIDFLNPSMSLL